MDQSIAKIWIISDDKQGHVNQSLGLVEALSRQVLNLTWQIIPAMSLWHAIRFSCIHKNKNELPQLLISAGHKTHLSLLILSKLLNIPCITLMKPSLPISWFDLCIIPQHDSPPSKKNVISSVGPLNRLQVKEKIPNSALILIGGSSKHFGWDSKQIINQITQITEQSSKHWLLTTSRRTPNETLDKLRKLTNIEVVPSATTHGDWLPSKLAQTEFCWVTQDSSSMIYEALTAGCKVNLLELPNKKTNRITQNLQQLRDTGYFNHSLSEKLPTRLAEADRCATLVLSRFLK
ncbi:MAG: ELM1/GtrOC1 family putative glycosyltransferase [Gammaproteobacteria bacterium]|nr:ELM1/GtrOC1 family putative glycosyltransferase [Gammaproteobacteria bacterium]